MSARDYFNLIWNFGTMSQTLKVYSYVGGMKWTNGCECVC